MNEKIPNLEDPYLEGLSEEQKERIWEAAKRIQELQKNFDVWGHGVSSREQAEQIVEHGLYTAWNAPQDIAYKLNDNPSSLVRQLRAWDYDAREFIVLMALKKDIRATDFGGMNAREKSIVDAKEHVFEEGTPPGGFHIPSNANKRVSQEKIIGYWDAKDYQIRPRLSKI